jgi:hypothetical protein
VEKYKEIIMTDRAYLEEWLTFLKANTRDNKDVPQDRQDELLLLWAQKINLTQLYKDKLEVNYINTLQQDQD